MASGVTYNGVASAQGGNIFKDLSFWVAQRVPTRDAILGYIRNNGGVVVALEKQADILIADHARKDAPAGSCSWKFVTESVEHGIIQLKDHYRIGPAPGVPRQVGSSRPIKGTRTPFTHTDDVVLVKWVLSQGRYFTGNKVYQDFESINPRHTWQSWRNRFVKGLMSRGQHYLEQLASEELPAEVEEAMQNADDGVANQPVDTPMRARGAEASASPFAPAVRAAATKARSPVKQKDATEHPEPLSRVPQPEQDAESEQPDPSSPVPETEQDAASGQPDPSSPVPEMQEDDGSVAMMQQFYSDLNEFVEATGAEIEVEHHVGGITFGLWELNQAVDAQKVPVDEVNWIMAAEDLGYDWDQDDQVSAALRQCYEANLVEFVEAMHSFGRDEEEDDEAPGEGHQRASSPEAHVPSSPPAQSIGKKRSRDIQQLPSSGRAKRRRLSRDAEIPSTLDEKIGYQVRLPVSPTHSPSVQRNMLRLGRSQSTDASQRLPPLSGPQRRGKHEAEAGGIVFENQVQPPARLETQQSSFDVSPSQQLRSEELDARPIPLNLERRRTEADGIRETEMSRPRGTGNADASASTQAKTQPPRRSLPVSFRSSANRGLARPVERPRQQQEPQPAREQTSGERDDNQRQIREVVEYYESLGYPHRIVVEALKRTTMTPGGLAALVMQSLEDGDGVPTHHEGVWTDRDDKSLRLVDSIQAEGESVEPKQRRRAKKEFDRLVAKHGLDRIELRRRFLDAEA
ncbi:Telomeric repeat-binding factor 2-interacting protein 1 [Tolypocladium paradoxum]|uniref:DNA-binding protein RAP1 n=1 Tax=Tolypocladium paradoxum TaxID=94208 RepID=A0A2S4L777_9HYPO|nr:Telomeric repeat-binding factor 2-interacting protein 1 [Tolypocladium paradoxum]